jgi:hypothetical protein
MSPDAQIRDQVVLAQRGIDLPSTIAQRKCGGRRAGDLSDQHAAGKRLARVKLRKSTQRLGVAVIGEANSVRVGGKHCVVLLASREAGFVVCEFGFSAPRQRVPRERGAW